MSSSLEVVLLKRHSISITIRSDWVDLNSKNSTYRRYQAIFRLQHQSRSNLLGSSSTQHYQSTFKHLNLDDPKSSYHVRRENVGHSGWMGSVGEYLCWRGTRKWVTDSATIHFLLVKDLAKAEGWAYPRCEQSSIKSLWLFRAIYWKGERQVIHVRERAAAEAEFCNLELGCSSW